MIEDQAPARDLELLAGWLARTAEVERLAERFQALASLVPAGVLVMTRTRVVYANAEVARITGRPADRLPTTPLAALFPDRALRARVRAALRRAWSGAAEDLGVVPIAREDGTTAHVRVQLRRLPREVEPTLLAVLHDPAGPVASAPASSDALRVFGLYLAGVASELRGPLTAYLGHLALLSRRTDLPEDLREAFELYRQVTAETLDRFSRAMEWGRRLPLVERVDLREVVTRAAAALEREVAPADVELLLDLSPVPPVAGNADQLQLAVEHVLRNAWEALMSRGGTIRVRLAAAERRVTLAVSDDGPGIPDSILPHVFDAFSSTKSIQAGLGLGLAIVQDIVSRHHGEIALTSSRAGTTVTFAFAAVEEPPGARRAASRRRVLLVEDNPGVQETYRMLLEKAGWEVGVALDADDALLAITREPADVLVVDVQMSGRDGLALIEALATWHPHQLGRVVLHTAYAYEDRVRAVAERYGLPLLEKPCPFDRLLATVARVAGAGAG